MALILKYSTAFAEIEIYDDFAKSEEEVKEISKRLGRIAQPVLAEQERQRLLKEAT